MISSDPYSNAISIDPRYFSNAFDRLAHAATVRFTRTLSNASQLKGIVTGESTPGNSVPTGASLESWASWASSNYRPNWHSIGTVAMMSRDLGGCLDSRNRVYGTTGLRVVDGSALPMQVSAHLMSTLYGLVGLSDTASVLQSHLADERLLSSGRARCRPRQGRQPGHRAILCHPFLYSHLEHHSSFLHGCRHPPQRGLVQVPPGPVLALRGRHPR